jgi:hypothetical protein
MILVLEKDDGSLFLFSSTEEAESHFDFEAIDVENGEYEFCDDRGQRFVGEIISPISMFRAGSFRLKPDGTPDTTIIKSLLSRARSLEHGFGEAKNLDDLRRLYDA